MEDFIYLDYNATSPCDAQVLEAMLPYFTQQYGNAGNLHYALGFDAYQAVEESRAQIAALIGALPQEIIFTSGATEANNLALRGFFEANFQKGCHIISAATEHKSVLDTLAYLAKKGADITYLPVNGAGMIAMEDLEKAIRPDTILICLMYGNNETGVLFPCEDIALLAKDRHIPLMSDVTQVLGKLPLDCKKTAFDMLTFSAHKIYGPKGMGALYIRHKSKNIKLMAQITGGGQERNLRSGTLNVPGIVGFGKAAEHALQQLNSGINHRLNTYRQRLEENLASLDIQINGKNSPRLGHVSNISFPCLDGKRLMQKLSATVAFSSGSACNSKNLSPSHVLKAMGLSDALASASLRFSLGKFTSADDIERVSQKILAFQGLGV